MSDYSRQVAAERAGVSLDELNQLVELEVLPQRDGDRFTAGDVRKAGLVHNLLAAGLPRDGMVAALRSGALSLDFMDSPVYQRFSSFSDVTFEELSNRTGVPVDLLMVVREAVGGSQPSPEDRVRDNELAIVPFIELQLKEGFRPIAIERLLRGHGDSLRRMAEQEADWWRSEVVLPRLQAGMSVPEVSNVDFSEELAALAEQARQAMFHAQQTRSWTSNIIEGVEYALTQAGVVSRLDRPPAMCFLDITGYTRLTQERGDEAAAELATELSRLVQRTSVQHGGKPVKWLGDGVMFFFRDPGPGVVAALDMVEGVAGAGLPPAHVGLHAGPVVYQEGDYYGQTVNVASRIAEYARPGEVVVSQAVVEASEGAGASFTEIGPVELKGVGGALQLHSAHRA
ncbi:MAG: adenylate/guanylate cyclase domain-containing protein [Candidatus Limnocylindria bacterium]